MVKQFFSKIEVGKNKRKFVVQANIGEFVDNGKNFRSPISSKLEFDSEENAIVNMKIEVVNIVKRYYEDIKENDIDFKVIKK